MSSILLVVIYIGGEYAKGPPNRYLELYTCRLAEFPGVAGLPHFEDLGNLRQAGSATGFQVQHGGLAVSSYKGGGFGQTNSEAMSLTCGFWV